MEKLTRRKLDSREGGQLLAEDKQLKTYLSFYFFLITLIKYSTGIKCKRKRVKAKHKIKAYRMLRKTPSEWTLGRECQKKTQVLSREYRQS